MFDRRLLSHFDWILLTLVLLICGIGLVAIYSATSSSPRLSGYWIRQGYWILLGMGGAFFALLLDYHHWTRFGFFMHIAIIALLVLVLFFGTGGPGSPVQRWLPIGPFFLQPSEFTKFTLVLSLAHYFRDSNRIGDLGWIAMLWPLVLTVTPMALIIKQPDLGTALLLLIVYIPIVFLAGIRIRVMLTVFGLGISALPIAWFYVLKPYQKGRILTFLNPNRDPLGAGYHIIQSKIAVGSGGFLGKGFEAGTQGRLNFLPAHHTDFIFAVFAEEWGFVGAITVLVLFLMLILWSLANVLNTRDRVSAILTVGIVTIITSHVLINIGMVLGLMPVVGMPLPFFSYGGSSMISMMFGVGLLLNIRMRRFEQV